MCEEIKNEEIVEETAETVTEEAVEETAETVTEEAVEETAETVTEEAVEETAEEVIEEAPKKESFFKKLLGDLKSRAFKSGGKCLLVSAIGILVIVGIIFGVSKIPTSYTKLDLTNNEMYSISDQTVSIASALEEKVTLYQLCTTGNENDLVAQLLEKYAGLSSKISYELIDPQIYPEFATQYTSDEISDNDILVVTENKCRHISSGDYYSYDSSTGNTNLEIEALVTSAIDYVTSDNLPVIYNLNGHGEYDVPDILSSALESENYEIADLSLLTVEAVPEDAAAVIICSPQTDISDDEYEMLEEYFDNGGKILAFIDYVEDGLTNIDKLMEKVGVTHYNGIVIEGSSNNCAYGMPHYILPCANSHDITDPLLTGNYILLIPISGGFTTGEDTGDYTVTSLLYTTDSAYCKLDLNTDTTDKADGDLDGPFDLAFIAENGESKLVVFGGTSLLAENINEAVSGANLDLVMNAIDYTCGKTDSVSIRAKEVTNSTLVIDNSSSNLWTAVIVALVPLGIIAAGIIITVKRKNAK